VWSERDELHLRTLDGHSKSVTLLACDANSGVVYSGSNDCTVRAWSGADGSFLFTLVGHTSPIVALAAGTDDKVIQCFPLCLCLRLRLRLRFAV
jgi:WD40 repeat protein